MAAREALRRDADTPLPDKVSLTGNIDALIAAARHQADIPAAWRTSPMAGLIREANEAAE